MAATGAPVVTVVVSGRPHGVARRGTGAPVYAFYPGPDGGPAIADVVLGGREPTGRLPVSLPRASGVLPVAYNERLETTLRYVDADAAAAFPFGAGLGYTTWELGPPAVRGLTVTATVTNTGPRAGATVVQLYGRVRVPGILPRRAVHLGHTRVALDAGEAGEVRVAVEPDARPALDGGRVELWLSVAGAGEPDRAVTVHPSAYLRSQPPSRSGRTPGRARCARPL